MTTDWNTVISNKLSIAVDVLYTYHIGMTSSVASYDTSMTLLMTSFIISMTSLVMLEMTSSMTSA